MLIIHFIYLLLLFTITCNKGAVKTTPSGESGTGTVGPTADWKGLMVTSCKLVVHIAGRVHIGEGVVGEAAAGELTGDPGGAVAHTGELTEGE